jgi:hypothetical protein
MEVRAVNHVLPSIHQHSITHSSDTLLLGLQTSKSFKVKVFNILEFLRHYQ